MAFQTISSKLLSLISASLRLELSGETVVRIHVQYMQSLCLDMYMLFVHTCMCHNNYMVYILLYMYVVCNGVHVHVLYIRQKNIVHVHHTIACTPLCVYMHTIMYVHVHHYVCACTPHHSMYTIMCVHVHHYVCTCTPLCMCMYTTP